MGDLKETTVIEKHIAITSSPIRLQEYGVHIFKKIITKSALKKAIKKELIYVNTQIATTATMIHGGEIITLQQPTKALDKRVFSLSLEVIFEDDYLALIHKPAGILVSGNAFKTIANALEPNLKKSTQIDATKPKPAHRLDFPTTGLLLIGKTSTALSRLNSLFENKKIAKTYFAVTIGAMKKKKSINIPIDDKNAVSRYELVNTIASEKFGCLNLLKLFPETGRRHQLRKHLATIANPILGDAKYGIEGSILKGKGLYLHAFSLAFVHPITNEKMYFEKELPNKFKKLFQTISISSIT